MILVFKVLAVIFMIIGIFATFTLLTIAIQGRIERKKNATTYYKETLCPDDVLAQSHPVDEECRGCLVNASSGYSFLICMRCRRAYKDGTEEREGYPDRYIKEEE